MYEVGLALACRRPEEVLLIRDDNDRFLFDVSTIPHVRIDFADTARATTVLQQHLIGRLQEQRQIADARVKKAMAMLTKEEVETMKYAVQHPTKPIVPPSVGSFGLFDHGMLTALPRLLDKQILKVTGKAGDGILGYALTPLGWRVAYALLASPPNMVVDWTD